jgi:hypothetical protein
MLVTTPTLAISPTETFQKKFLEREIPRHVFTDFRRYMWKRFLTNALTRLL